MRQQRGQFAIPAIEQAVAPGFDEMMARVRLPLSFIELIDRPRDLLGVEPAQHPSDGFELPFSGSVTGDAAGKGDGSAQVVIQRQVRTLALRQRHEFSRQVHPRERFAPALALADRRRLLISFDVVHCTA